MKHQHFISRRLGAPQEISRESRSMAEYAYAGTHCTREGSRLAKIGKAIVGIVIAAGALAMMLSGCEQQKMPEMAANGSNATRMKPSGAYGAAYAQDFRTPAGRECVALIGNDSVALSCDWSKP